MSFTEVLCLPAALPHFTMPLSRPAACMALALCLAAACLHTTSAAHIYSGAANGPYEA